MKHYSRFVNAIIMAMTITVSSSCKMESYETGDGDLSYMKAEMADISIHNHEVTSIISDSNEPLLFSPTLTVSATLPADTMLRRMLYFSYKGTGRPSKLLKNTNVSVVSIHNVAETDGMKTDPLKLTSAWMSQNGKYLNMQLGIMTGNDAPEDTRQLVQLICDSVSTTDRGHLYLSVYHDQAGYPEYYTQNLYLSIPTTLDAMPHNYADLIKGSATTLTSFPDTISLTINTYSGKITKTIIR